jgi:hypothetical protein
MPISFQREKRPRKISQTLQLLQKISFFKNSKYSLIPILNVFSLKGEYHFALGRAREIQEPCSLCPVLTLERFKGVHEVQVGL